MQNLGALAVDRGPGNITLSTKEARYICLYRILTHTSQLTTLYKSVRIAHILQPHFQGSIFLIDLLIQNVLGRIQI